jgi:hypothetical protein
VQFELAVLVEAVDAEYFAYTFGEEAPGGEVLGIRLEIGEIGE